MPGGRFDGPDLWMAFLDGLGIDAPRARLLATEGARLGCLFAHGLLREDSAILSDDAGQFDLGLHQFLCWIHARGSIARCRSGATPAVRPSMRCAAASGGRTGCLAPIAASQVRADAPSSSASFARTFRTGTGYRPASTSRSGAPSPTATSCSPCSTVPTCRAHTKRYRERPSRLCRPPQGLGRNPLG